MNTEAFGNGPAWVVGFMTGTSIDAVDGAAILTDGRDIVDFGPTVERKFSAAERRRIQTHVQAARDWNWTGEAPDWSDLEALLTEVHMEALEQLRGDMQAAPVLAGIHGQTVLHRRPGGGVPGATRQIFDGRGFAKAAGIPTVFDFRTADVQAGGEGAPLAPAYHRALAARSGRKRLVVLNLGGVANITWTGEPLLAFDTGPANGPIDEWIEGHEAGQYDEGGQLAAAGRVHEGLLVQLLDHPYLGEAPPKSLDRYDFDANMVRGLSLEDGAATLTAFSARAVAAGIGLLPERPDRVVACGGGRHNPALMMALEEALEMPVVKAEDMGWRGDSIEAEAFAFLAARHVQGLPLSYPGTTGVDEPALGGVLALAG